MQPGEGPHAVYRLSKVDILSSSSSEEGADRVADLPRGGRLGSGRYRPSEGGESNVSAPVSLASTMTERTMMKDTLDNVRRKLSMMASPPTAGQPAGSMPSLPPGQARYSGSGMPSSHAQPHPAGPGSSSPAPAIPKLEGLLSDIVVRLSKIEDVYTDMSGKLSRVDHRTAENERSVKELQHISAGAITETARLVDIMGGSSTSRAGTPGPQPGSTAAGTPQAGARAGRSSSRQVSQTPSAAGNVAPEQQVAASQVSSTLHQHASQIHKLIAGLDFLEQHIIRQDQAIEAVQQQLHAVSSQHQAGASPELSARVQDVGDLANKLRSQLYKVDKKVGSADASLQSLDGQLQQVLLRLEQLEKARLLSTAASPVDARTTAELATLSESHGEVRGTVLAFGRELHSLAQQVAVLQQAVSSSSTASQQAVLAAPITAQPAFQDVQAELACLREEVQQMCVEPAPASVGQVHKLEAEIAALREEVVPALAAAASRPAAANAAVKQLQGSVDGLATELQQLSVAAAADRATAAVTSTAVSEIRAKVAELAPAVKVAALESDMAALRQRMAGVMKSVEEQLSTLQHASVGAASAAAAVALAAAPRRVAPAAADEAAPSAALLAQLQQAMEQLSASVGDMQGRVTATDAAAAVGQVRQQEAEAQLKALKQMVEELASKGVVQQAVGHATFRAITDKLAADMQQVKSEGGVLAGELKAVWGSVGSLSDDLLLTKGDLAALTKDAATLKGDLGGVASDVQRVRDDVGVVRGDLQAVVTSSVTPLSEALDGVKAGVGMLSGELQQVRAEAAGLATGLQAARADAAEAVQAVKADVQAVAENLAAARGELASELQGTKADLQGLAGSLQTVVGDVAQLGSGLQQVKGDVTAELQLVKAGVGAHSGALQLVKQQLAAMDAAQAADPMVTSSVLDATTSQLAASLEAVKQQMEGGHALQRAALSDWGSKHERVAAHVAELDTKQQQLEGRAAGAEEQLQRLVAQGVQLGQQLVAQAQELQAAVAARAAELQQRLAGEVSARDAQHQQLSAVVSNVSQQVAQLSETSAAHDGKQQQLAGQLSELASSMGQEHAALHAAVSANTAGVGELRGGLDAMLGLVQESVGAVQAALQQQVAGLREAAQAEGQQVAQELGRLAAQLQDAERTSRVISSQVVDLAARLDTELAPSLTDLTAAHTTTRAELQQLGAQAVDSASALQQLAGKHAGTQGAVQQLEGAVGRLGEDLEAVRGALGEAQARMGELATNVQLVGLADLVEELQGSCRDTASGLEGLRTLLASDYYISADKLQGLLAARDDMQAALGKLAQLFSPTAPVAPAAVAAAGVPGSPAGPRNPATQDAAAAREPARSPPPPASGPVAAADLSKAVSELQSQVQLVLYRTEAMVRQDQLAVLQRNMMGLELQLREWQQHPQAALGAARGSGAACERAQLPAPAAAAAADAARGGGLGGVSDEVEERVLTLERQLTQLHAWCSRLLPAVEQGLPDLRNSVQDLQLMLFDLRGARLEATTPRTRDGSANGAAPQSPFEMHAPLGASRFKEQGIEISVAASEVADSVAAVRGTEWGDDDSGGAEGSDDAERTALRAYHSFAAPDGARAGLLAAGDADDDSAQDLEGSDALPAVRAAALDTRVADLAAALRALEGEVRALKASSTQAATAAAASPVAVDSGDSSSMQLPVQVAAEDGSTLTLSLSVKCEDTHQAGVAATTGPMGIPGTSISELAAAVTASPEFADVVDGVTAQLASLESRVLGQASTLAHLTTTTGLTVELGHQVQVLAEQLAVLQQQQALHVELQPQVQQLGVQVAELSAVSLAAGEGLLQRVQGLGEQLPGLRAAQQEAGGQLEEVRQQVAGLMGQVAVLQPLGTLHDGLQLQLTAVQQQVATLSGQVGPAQDLLQQQLEAVKQLLHGVQKGAATQAADLRQEMELLSAQLTVLEPLGQLQEGVLEQVQLQGDAVQKQLAELDGRVAAVETAVSLQAVQQDQADDESSLRTRLQHLESMLAVGQSSDAQVAALKQQVQVLCEQVPGMLADQLAAAHIAELKQQVQQLEQEVRTLHTRMQEQQAVPSMHTVAAEGAAAAVPQSEVEAVKQQVAALAGQVEALGPAHTGLQQQLGTIQQQLQRLEKATGSQAADLRQEMELVSAQLTVLEPLGQLQEGVLEQVQLQSDAVQKQMAELSGKVAAVEKAAALQAADLKQELEVVSGQLTVLEPLGQLQEGVLEQVQLAHEEVQKQLQQLREQVQVLSASSTATITGSTVSAAPQQQQQSEAASPRFEALKVLVDGTATQLEVVQQQVQQLSVQVAALPTSSAQLSAANLEALQAGGAGSHLGRRNSCTSLGSLDVVSGVSGLEGGGFGLHGAMGMGGGVSILSNLPASVPGAPGSVGGQQQQQRFLHRLLEVVRRQSSRLHAQYGQQEEVEGQLAQVDHTLAAVAQQLECPATSPTSSSSAYAEAMVAILEQVAALRSIGPKAAQGHAGPEVQLAVQAHEEQLKELQQVVKELCAATMRSGAAAAASEAGTATLQPLADRLSALEEVVNGLSSAAQARQAAGSNLGDGAPADGAAAAASVEGLEAKLGEYGKVLQALRNRVVALQEVVEGTQGRVQEVDALHGSLVLRLATLETDLADRATTRDGAVAGGAADLAQLRELQAELRSLESQVVSLQASQLQAATALEGLPRLEGHVAELDAQQGELDAKMTSMGQTLPMLAGQLQALELSLQVRMEAGAAQLAALSSALAEVGRLEKPDSKNPFAGIAPAGSNPAVKLLASKLELMRASLAGLADTLGADLGKQLDA